MGVLMGGGWLYVQLSWSSESANDRGPGRSEPGRELAAEELSQVGYSATFFGRIAVKIGVLAGSCTDRFTSMARTV